MPMLAPQVEFADVILLNKCDLVSRAQRAEIAAALKVRAGAALGTERDAVFIYKKKLCSFSWHCVTVQCTAFSLSHMRVPAPAPLPRRRPTAARSA
jgi:hypothetical protein